MNYTQFSLLQCPHCHQSVVILPKESGEMQIAKCACNEYPFWEGIFYCKNDNTRRKTVELIKRRKYLSALFVLLQVNKKLFLGIYIIFLCSLFHKIFEKITRKKFHECIGFERSISFLEFFSYNRAWGKYLRYRLKNPTLFFSYVANTWVADNKGYVVDLGCGVGQALPNLIHKMPPFSVIAIDQSFFSLFLARKYFSSREVLFICCDIEEGLPFKSSAVRTVITTDTFHYIQHKKKLVQEIYRITDSNRLFICMHTVQKTLTEHSNILPVSVKEIQRISSKAGYKHFSIIDNESLWISLREQKNGRLLPTPLHQRKQEYVDFSFICSDTKQAFPLTLNSREVNKIQEHYTYFQTSHIPSAYNLYTLLQHYHTFIFLSPHLDDVVLSCSRLMHKLKQEHKQVHVITVFTQATSLPNSPQAKDFLAVCGFTDADKLFIERREEDRKAMNFLQVSFQYLGLVDAAWRNVYKNAQTQFSGNIAPQDKILIAEIAGMVKQQIKKPETTLIISPLGIGGHVDHCIARAAIESISNNILFYQDYPYRIIRDTHTKSMEQKKFVFSVDTDNDVYRKAKSYYRTYLRQEKVLFPDGCIPEIPESYYRKKT